MSNIINRKKKYNVMIVVAKKWFVCVIFARLCIVGIFFFFLKKQNYFCIQKYILSDYVISPVFGQGCLH